MYDDKCLVDLINKRFDDTHNQIVSLKNDLIRQAEDIRRKTAEFEEHTNTRFTQVSNRLQAFDKIIWKATGAACATIAIAQGLIVAIQHFAK